MFIREIRKLIKKQGQTYEYVQHRLVESIRTERGPRQQVLLDMGTLPVAKEHFKALANLIEQYLNNCGVESSLFGEVSEEITVLARHYADCIRRKRLKNNTNLQPDTTAPTITAERAGNGGTVPPPPASTDRAVHRSIDPSSVITSDARTIGAEHVATSQFEELGFRGILEACGFSERERKLAAAQVCARLVHPASERETARWLRESSALGELLGIDLAHCSDQILHRITDKIIVQKDTIEQELATASETLFSLGNNKVILYDLTNTYFESPKRSSSIAKYGKSKEKRDDCPLITLALVVDAYGFPKRSKVLEGNISEPDTLFTVLEQLGAIDPAAPKTVVIDAGIATEENLSKLRADGRFEYVAISRSRTLHKELFTDVPVGTVEMSHGEELTVSMVRQEYETFLLCKSSSRQLKEEGMLSRRKEIFEKALAALNEALGKPRTRKSAASVHERIGRIKERSRVGHLYTIDITEENGTVGKITWAYHAQNSKEECLGEYLIRTSRTDLAAEEISLIHRTLTMVESAFAWLKSSLGLRPNFHQKDSRVSAHASISVLAYFLLAPILHKIQWGGMFIGCTPEVREEHYPWSIPYGWKGVTRTLSSQVRVTTSFKCEDGRSMDVRTTVEPTLQQQNVYKRLGLNPRPLKRVIVSH
jgi:transposase